MSNVRGLLRDTALLYVLSGLKLLSPLVMPALLAHKLARDELGQFAITLSIATTLSIFVELGFGLSAARAAAGRPADEQRRINGAVVSARLAGAILLLPLCVAAVALLLRRSDAGVLLVGVVTWATAVCVGLTHLWFFQVDGRLPLFAAFEVAGIGSALAAVFLFGTDLVTALACNLLVSVVPLVVSSAVLLVRLGRPDLSFGAAMDGWRLTRELAKFRVITTSYTAAMPAVLGARIAPAYIAPFFVAERFARALLAGFVPAAQIAYPRMCELRERDTQRHVRIVGKLLYAAGAVGLALCAFMVFLSRWIAAVLSPAPIVPDVARHLTELAWIVPPVAVATVLGSLFMLPRGEDRLFNRILSLAALCGFALVWTLPGRMGATGASVALVTAELVGAGGMLLSYVRHTGRTAKAGPSATTATAAPGTPESPP